MNKRGRWGSMADRTSALPAAPAPVSEPGPEAPPLKHCFVTDGHGRLPALLLEWRRTADGFQGRVVRPVVEDGVWLVVEEWLSAELLEPT